MIIIHNQTGWLKPLLKYAYVNLYIYIYYYILFLHIVKYVYLIIPHMFFKQIQIVSQFHGSPVLGNELRYLPQVFMGYHQFPDNLSVYIWWFPKMGGTPKSSISIHFSSVNHAFWGTPTFRKPPYVYGYICPTNGDIFSGFKEQQQPWACGQQSVGMFVRINHIAMNQNSSFHIKRAPKVCSNPYLDGSMLHVNWRDGKSHQKLLCLKSRAMFRFCLIHLALSFVQLLTFDDIPILSTHMLRGVLLEEYKALSIYYWNHSGKIITSSQRCDSKWCLVSPNGRTLKVGKISLLCFTLVIIIIMFFIIVFMIISKSRFHYCVCYFHYYVFHCYSYHYFTISNTLSFYHSDSNNQRHTWNHDNTTNHKFIFWLVVSNIFPFQIWDVIPTPLTNIDIFQDGYCTTNQFCYFSRWLLHHQPVLLWPQLPST